MRHRRGNKKLGKPTDQRIAMIRSLVRSLLIHEKIKTTDKRAAAAKSYAEKLITLGIKGDLHSRRQALSLLPDKTVITKLFNEIAPKITKKSGGYLRTTKIGELRRGDNSRVSILEFA